MGFSTADLSQVFLFCSTPSGLGAGSWGAGYKIATDNDGYMVCIRIGISMSLSITCSQVQYAVFGNGWFNDDPSNFDANGFPIDGDWANGVLKLQLDATVLPDSGYINGWGIRVVDFFMPYDTVRNFD
jgi:hypothetical protein